MIRVDRFVSPPQAGATVTDKKGMFTHFWLTWFIGITDAIFLLEDRFKQTSLNMLYLSRADSSPIAGEFYYDDAANILYVNKTLVSGMVLPDLVNDSPLRVEIFESRDVYVVSTSVGTVTITSDVYAIPFLGNSKSGSISLSGVKNLGLHWQ